MACYRALIQPDDINSVIELLSEALHDAPEFGDSLATENLDRDLVPLLGDPVFERWRDEVLNKKR